MEILRIALAQVNMTLGDFENNFKKIIYHINRAISDEVDIITFPELALSGYPPEDLLNNNDFLEANKIYINKIVKHAKNIAAVVGFVDHNEGPYNAAAIICDQNLVDVYHKVLLPNYGVFDEKRHFKAGVKCPVYQLGKIIFGVTICEDIWSPLSQIELWKSPGLCFSLKMSFKNFKRYFYFYLIF